jgi:signal transduction histidine kinase
MPFADADFDPNCPMVRARLRAGDLLAERGVYGLVWLDDDLIVRRRYGVVVDFIEVDAPLVQSLLPVIGLEDEIKALKGVNDGTLRLPSVATMTPDGPGPRLNLLFYAIQTDAPFVMIVAPAPATGNLEVELTRQVRARLIAEAEVVAKSQALARTNAELTAANANLEQFAAIVTHDLKAPMRAVRYLVDDIEAAIGPCGGNGTVTSKLQDLRRQTGRLSSMLSTLLHYVCVTPSAEAIETVDTKAMVAEIVRSLPHDGHTIEIRGTWPKLETFATPLDVTLRNLIENTIRHHDRDKGHLIISCADSGSALGITIEDDGPGIAPEHHDSVFMPFRAVGNGGGGMGLAIVQKMVDTAGGTISISSSPATQRGTTFKVEWPKKIAL